MAIEINQMTMMGPNIAATLAVPRLCAANKAIRIITVNGTTKSPNAGLASLSPSTADSTEIAGVITESPRNIEAPITPRIKTRAVRRPSARVASAVSDRVPPSPLLSARSRRSTYFSVTVMMSAQSDFARYDRVIARGHRGFAKGIKWAGPDIAVHDANAAERKRNEARRRVSSGARGGRRFTPAIIH